MCKEKCLSTLVPIYNGTTKEFEKVVCQFVFEFDDSDIIPDGIDSIASSLDADNALAITLNVTRDAAKPRVKATTPVVHTLEFTKTELISFGFSGAHEGKVTFRVNYKIDGDVLEDINGGPCWVECSFNWLWGMYVCRTICLWRSHKDSAGDSAM